MADSDTIKARRRSAKELRTIETELNYFIACATATNPHAGGGLEGLIDLLIAAQKEAHKQSLSCARAAKFIAGERAEDEDDS